MLRAIIDYLDVPNSAKIPLALELRAPVEVLAARRAPEPTFTTATPQVILVVPGFLDDGRGVEGLIEHLRKIGHTVHLADVGRNVDCGERMAERLERELERVSSEADTKVTLVGHSRGGSLSRAVAVRRPELVRTVVALGSPLSEPHGITLALKVVKLGMWGLSRVGVPGLIGDCAFGDCCSAYHQDLTGPFPADVHLVSLRSTLDGFVSPTASLDPAAEVIDLTVTHIGLAAAPSALRAITEVLDRTAQRQTVAA